jgi:hypothetical protein
MATLIFAMVLGKMEVEWAAGGTSEMWGEGTRWGSSSEELSLCLLLTLTNTLGWLFFLG